MRLLRRRSDATDNMADQAAEVSVGGTAPKGRPTPKRRDSAPRRPTITQAPRNRKEAYRWQKQQAQNTRPSGGAPMSREAQRAAIARGDESALPRRDQGPVRRLARNWVDSRRMFSNYLLLVFPLLLVGLYVPFAGFVMYAIVLLVAVEWYVTGRRIITLARQRNIEVRSGPWSIGFYAGNRAFMPRRWRLPKPQVGLGQPI